MRKFKTFKQLHNKKLKGAMATWVKKNGRPHDTFKFIIQKKGSLFILNYKV